MKTKFLKRTLSLIAAASFVRGGYLLTSSQRVVSEEIADPTLVSFHLRRGALTENYKLHIQLLNTGICNDYNTATSDTFISKEALGSKVNVLDYVTFETWSGESVKLSEVALSDACYGFKVWGDTAPFVQLDLNSFGGEQAKYQISNIKGFRIHAGCEFPSVDLSKKFVITNTFSGTYADGNAVDGKFISHTTTNGDFKLASFGYITILNKIGDTTAEVKVDNGNATFDAIWISTPEYAGLDAAIQSENYNKAFALQGDFTIHFFDKILVDGYRLSDETQWGVLVNEAQVFYQTRYMIGIPMPAGFNYKDSHTITLEKGLELPHWTTTSVFDGWGLVNYYVNTKDTTTYTYNGSDDNNLFNGYSKVEELTLTGMSGNFDKHDYGANIHFASSQISSSFNSTDIYTCEGFTSNVHYYGEDGAEITLTPRGNTRIMYGSESFLIQLDPDKGLTDDTNSLVKKVVVKKGAWLPSYEMFTTNTGVKYVTSKDYTFYYRLENKDFLAAENVVESGDRISTSVIEASTYHNEPNKYYNVSFKFSSYDGDANANTEPVTVGTRAMIVREQIKCYDTNGDLIKDISIRDQVFNCIWNSHFLVQIPYAGEIAKIVLPKGSLIPSKAMADTGTGCYYVTDADVVIYETGAATYKYESSFISKVGAAMSLAYQYECNDNVYSNVKFRILCGIDKAAMDTTLNKVYSQNATYGIEVTDGTTTQKANKDKLREKDGMYYITIELGDIFKHPERATTEFTIRAFVTDNGQTDYSSATKTYSIKSMVETYYGDSRYKASVTGLYNILNPGN